MAKPYMIRIGSQNGGVGKTAIAVNLASALSLMKYNVLLVDGDTISPSTNTYLGLKDIKREIGEILFSKMDIGIIMAILNKINIKDLLSIDQRTGLHVLPGVVTNVPVSQEESDKYIVEKISQLDDFDFAIFDTHAGIYYESIMKLYDEEMIISLPTMKSITFAIQLNEICKRVGSRASFVLNRVSRGRGELGVEALEEALGERVLVSIPEDDINVASEEKRIPAVLLNKNSQFSKRIFDLARICAGKVAKK